MRLILILIISAFTYITPTSAQAEQKIATVVNHQAITQADFQDRLRLILVSSGLKDSPDTRNKLSLQVMNSLIDEQLRLQEAERLELKISDEEIAQGFERIAAQNKLPPEQFHQALVNSKVNIETIKRQIRSQLAWSKVVQQEIAPQITVTDSDVDSYLADLNQNIGKTEYLLSEILLTIDNPEDENSTSKLAQKLAQDIRAKRVPFPRVAQQFSKAPGAPQGGNMGWVQQEQLPQEIQSALSNMQKDTVSAPIRSPLGYHLMLLRNQRQMQKENLPSRDEIRSKIGIERIERRQKHHLLNLKSNAFIENRIQP